MLSLESSTWRRGIALVLQAEGPRSEGSPVERPAKAHGLKPDVPTEVIDCVKGRLTLQALLDFKDHFCTLHSKCI